MVMIGIDPHKRATHTAVAVDDREVVLDETARGCVWRPGR